MWYEFDSTLNYVMFGVVILKATGPWIVNTEVIMRMRTYTVRMNYTQSIIFSEILELPSRYNCLKDITRYYLSI